MDKNMTFTSGTDCYNPLAETIKQIKSKPFTKNNGQSQRHPVRHLWSTQHTSSQAHSIRARLWEKIHTSDTDAHKTAKSFPKKIIWPALHN